MHKGFHGVILEQVPPGLSSQDKWLGEGKKASPGEQQVSIPEITNMIQSVRPGVGGTDMTRKMRAGSWRQQFSSLGHIVTLALG